MRSSARARWKRSPAMRSKDGRRSALRRASARRIELAHAIRRRQAVLAGALVAPSWQSPSIRHARCNQAGPAEGRVTAHRDDYARDRHPAGAAYERALVATRSPGDAALLTSCGMSAVVVEGASFGLDTARVYAPSPGEGAACGFVRVSAGSEHAEALRRLARVLVRALREA
jgi:hypothetical protein